MEGRNSNRIGKSFKMGLFHLNESKSVRKNEGQRLGGRKEEKEGWLSWGNLMRGCGSTKRAPEKEIMPKEIIPHLLGHRLGPSRSGVGRALRGQGEGGKWVGLAEMGREEI